MEQKKNVICQANTHYNKKKLGIHSMGLYWSFIRNKYLYPRSTILRKKLLNVSHCPVEQKKNVICQANTHYNKKTRYTLKGTIVEFHTKKIFISPSSTISRKNCLCKHYLQNIVLWSEKERDLSSKYIL